MNPTKKLAIATVTAALTLGAGSGLLLSMPGGASAASTPADTVVADDSTTTDSGTTDAGTDVDSDSGKPARGERFSGGLQSLVDDGTITAEQRDALVAEVQSAHAAAEAAGTEHNRGTLLSAALAAQVSSGALTQAQADAITAAAPVGRGGKGGGMGGRHGGRGRFVNLETAATALGITADELQTELAAGKTIADVAGEKGVAVQTVIDQLVAEATAELTQRITDKVNGLDTATAAETSGSVTTD